MKRVLIAALQPALITFLICGLSNISGNRQDIINAWMVFSAIMLGYYIAIYGFDVLKTRKIEWRLSTFTITQLIFMMIFIGPFQNNFLLVSCLLVYGLAQYIESKNILPTETLVNSKDKIMSMIHKVRIEERELEQKLRTRFNNLL
jgi:hypothetical protein